MATFGEISWNDVSTDSSSKKNSKDLFLRLEKGTNVVRIITAPHQYLVHRYKAPGDPGFGQKVLCSAIHGSCPVCQTGDKPKRRWFIGVIERKTGMSKILDISFSVFKNLQNLVRDEDWGEPDKYDIDIFVDPNGGATNYYSVKPKPAKALTAADLVARENFDAEELTRRCTPPTPDKVMERMEKINGSVPGATAAANTVAMASVATSPAKSKITFTDVEDDDENMDFKNYDNKSA